MSFAAVFKSNVTARPEAFSVGIDNLSSAKKAGDDPSRFADSDGRVMSAAEVTARAVDVEIDHIYQEVRMIGLLHSCDYFANQFNFSFFECPFPTNNIAWPVLRCVRQQRYIYLLPLWRGSLLLQELPA